MPANSISENHYRITLEGQELMLNADCTMYWPDQKTLVISDLHIGKVMHFRKFGYAIPLESINKNWDLLSTALLNHDINTCIFLGDLYHSQENTETDVFWGIIDTFEHIRFILVKGNHDVHSPLYYEKKGLEVYDEYTCGPFKFTHEPLENKAEKYNIAGHIHPAIRLRGKGRSYMKLPCFSFSEHQAILPAFGVFTGTHALSPSKNDKIIAVLEGKSLAEIEV